MNDADQEILNHFRRTRDKTIDLLRAVPHDCLTRKPDGEKGNVAEIFAHIASGVDHWMEQCMRDPGHADRPAAHTKEALLPALEASRDRLLRFFETNDGQAMAQVFSHPRKPNQSYTGRNRVLYLTQHEAHHRGKMVLALRQWGFSDIPFLPY